jgi:hypothetical protein
MLNVLQVLDEPGRDTSKFDTIMPTVVRPCTKDTFSSPEVSRVNQDISSPEVSRVKSGHQFSRGE